MHSVMDYGAAGVVLACALSDRSGKARAASLLIGASGLVASLLTDYRLSLKKLIPIETHEVIDYAFGITAVSAPFVLGYHRRAPRVAFTHVMAGLGTILAALVTDYRAERGIGRH